jgi:hypothetical protein
MSDETTRRLGNILQQTRDLVTVKRAEFGTNLQKEGADKELDTSGAGDDSPKTRGHALEADQAALEPQKKPALSDDANAEPPSDGKGTTGGAEGKDESNETDRTVKLESEDPAPVNLKKKPAETDDAFAKECEDGPAKIANEILTAIREFQTSQEKGAEGETGEKPEGEKKNPDAEGETEGEKGAEGEKAKDKTPEAEGEKGAEGEAKDDDKPAEGEQKNPDAEGEKGAESKKAGETDQKPEGEKGADSPNMELTTDVLAKIAAVILSQEDGEEVVSHYLAKAAGAELAQETMAFLATQSEMAEKAAAAEQGAADAQALIDQSIFAAGQESVKGAAADQSDPAFWLKLGQAAADASIEDLMGAGGGAPMAGGMGGGGEMGVSPEELAAGGAGGEMGGMEQEPSIEEVLQALEELVQSGQIGEEEAAQILEMIGGEGGGGEVAPEAGAEEAGGGAPPAGGAEEAGGGEPAGEEKPAEAKKPETEKAAGGPKVQELLQTIQALRSK